MPKEEKRKEKRQAKLRTYTLTVKYAKERSYVNVLGKIHGKADPEWTET